MINDDTTDSTEAADAHHDEEAQEDRGEMGSRDQGEGPGGGAAGRDTGTSEPRDYTSINPEDPDGEAAPAQA